MSPTHHSQDERRDLDARGSETDTELFDFYVAQLEAYLDGELSGEEAIAVRQRLIQEEAYAAALGRLHAQRAQRAEVFASIEREEVDPQAAARINATFRQLSLKDAASSRSHAWPRWAKIAIGMAACLLVGFGAGLVGIYDIGTTPAQPSPTPYTAQVQPTSGFTGWVRYDNGQPLMELPAENRPMPNPVDQEPDYTLQVLPR